jgi:hypothetical protein
VYGSAVKGRRLSLKLLFVKKEAEYFNPCTQFRPLPPYKCMLSFLSTVTTTSFYTRKIHSYSVGITRRTSEATQENLK